MAVGSHEAKYCWDRQRRLISSCGRCRTETEGALSVEIKGGLSVNVKFERLVLFTVATSALICLTEILPPERMHLPGALTWAAEMLSVLQMNNYIPTLDIKKPPLTFLWLCMELFVMFYLSPYVNIVTNM